MKILSFILAIFMFSVSLLPCTDANEMSTEYAVHSEHHHDAHTHIADHNHEDHEDTCAPFCLCDCCGVSIVDPQFVHYKGKMESIPLQNKSYYSFLYTFQYSNGVWHPPALA